MPPPPAVNPDLVRAGLQTAAENPELVKAGAAAAYENREMLGAAASAVADNADLFAGGGLFGDDASAAAPADTDALANKFGSLFGDA